jgi:hypothetical protein
LIVDVQDVELNRLLNGLLVGFAAIVVLSIVPWPLRNGRNRWTLALPWIGLLLYGAYEWLMPARMDIRLDLLAVWPLGILVFFLWGIRLWRIRWLRTRAEKPNAS